MAVLRGFPPSRVPQTGARTGARAMRPAFMVGAIALVTVLSAPTFAREADGEALAWKYHCVSCHGERGVARSPQYPMLVGQNAAYLEARLRYFRAEEEPGNVMNGQAAPLSDEEIEALARYFSGQS